MKHIFPAENENDIHLGVLFSNMSFEQVDVVVVLICAVCIRCSALNV